MRRPPRSTQSRSSAASDVYKRQGTTLTKTGDGTLALGYSGNTLAHLTVEEGTLAFTGGATIGVNPNNATIVRVSEGASLALSGGTVNLHAQLNGAGTITIGTADAAGQVNISNTGNTNFTGRLEPVSYTHLRAHETRHDLVCRLLLEKKKKKKRQTKRTQNPR